MLERVLAQAKRYGESVRLLEDAGFEQDRARARKAWLGFRRQFQESVKLHALVVHAYLDAYSKE